MDLDLLVLYTQQDVVVMCFVLIVLKVNVFEWASEWVSISVPSINSQHNQLTLSTDGLFPESMVCLEFWSTSWASSSPAFSLPPSRQHTHSILFPFDREKCAKLDLLSNQSCSGKGRKERKFSPFLGSYIFNTQSSTNDSNQFVRARISAEGELSIWFHHILGGIVQLIRRICTTRHILPVQHQSSGQFGKEARKVLIQYNCVELIVWRGFPSKCWFDLLAFKYFLMIPNQCGRFELTTETVAQHWILWFWKRKTSKSSLDFVDICRVCQRIEMHKTC